jgi:hypothetical protein
MPCLNGHVVCQKGTIIFVNRSSRVKKFKDQGSKRIADVWLEIEAKIEIHKAWPD